jgi:hypothetical protein
MAAAAGEYPSRGEAMARRLRLIMIPAIISLCMTLLRLFGELGHWSERWFEPVTRGILPGAVGWVFGITWLAIPFGIYFAWRLFVPEQEPKSVTKAVGAGFSGLLLSLLSLYMIVPFLNSTFHLREQGLLPYLVVIWGGMAIAVIPSIWAWPELAKTLAVYGLAARLPVAITMFLAMRGNWGTHYDYVDIPQFQSIPFWERFLTTAFIPQLVFWVAFTMMIGGLAGSLAAVVASRVARKA